MMGKETMTKRIIAILGTVTTMTLIAVGGWLIFQPEPAVAAKSDWLTDMQKAQEVAATEKKDLLINFTGSDWCGWCIRLRDEVFSKDEFETALEKFVLVEMDFPSDESIVPPKTREQNEVWSNRFGIEGFPTIVLTDSQGRPYGSLGYVPGGPPAFLAQLDKIRKVRESRDEQLAKSKDAKGLDKAKLLASALETIPAEFHLPMYRAEVQEIISLDGQDEAGLKTRFTQVLQQADAEERLKKLQEEVRLAYSKDGADAALKLVQDALKAKDTQSNPVLRSNLAQAEVNLLVTFEKPKQALARLEELTKDKTFSKEDQRSFRERQASLFKEAGQTDDALKAYDALIAEAGDSAENVLTYLTEKAEVLTQADRPKEALQVYNSVINKTEKGSNEWLTVQLNRGELLKKNKQPKEAAGVFDEMLTVESLVPVQKAMLLVYAAEAYHEAKDATETEARIQKADTILKELGKSEEIPPQFLEQLEGRLDAVRKDGKAKEKTEEKPKTE
jgi:thioredoxin-related protein